MITLIFPYLDELKTHSLDKARAFSKMLYILRPLILSPLMGWIKTNAIICYRCGVSTHSTPLYNISLIFDIIATKGIMKSRYRSINQRNKYG